MLDEAPRDQLRQGLAQVRELLEKQRLVEGLAHRDRSQRHELVESLVHRQHLSELHTKLSRLHIADVAYILTVLPPDERLLVWRQTGRNRGGDVLLEVPEEVRQWLIEAMEPGELTEVLNQLDAEDLAYIADELPEDALQQRLQSLTLQDRQWLVSTMAYDEDAVGHLMSPDMVTVREDFTLGQVLETLRNLEAMPIHSDKLLVVNGRGILTGVLSLSALLLGSPSGTVAGTMATNVVTFRPEEMAREAAKAFERYDLASAPVVNERGKLLGRLTVDVVMDYIREEQEEKILVRAGLSGGEDLFASVWDSARNRWLWLSINLFTAFLASRVIGLFEGTIAQVVALAALMPIVSGVGGNTGNQTTAIIIRGLALEQIGHTNLWRLARKELAVSLLNGLVWGGVMGLVAYGLYWNPGLGLVMAAAMPLNMLIAGVVGLAVPLGLERWGRDPALGSSVLLTATTDAMGFFIFLGLASLFLL